MFQPGDIIKKKHSFLSPYFSDDNIKLMGRDIGIIISHVDNLVQDYGASYWETKLYRIYSFEADKITIFHADYINREYELI